MNGKTLEELEEETRHLQLLSNEFDESLLYQRKIIKMRPCVKKYSK